MSRIFRRGWLIGCSLAFAAALLSMAACSKTPADDLVPVSGQIILDGHPLSGGAISLRPESRETWHQPTGAITPEGRYTVYTTNRPGAPPGRYRVVVFSTGPSRTAGTAAHPGMPKSVIPMKYNDPNSTPLRIDVVATPLAEAYDLELVSPDGPPSKPSPSKP